MGVVGGYELHLYCDDPKHITMHGREPTELGSINKRDAMRTARKMGWRTMRWPTEAPLSLGASRPAMRCPVCAGTGEGNKDG